MTIRFYLRGGSKDDVNYLRESVRSRKEELGKKVDGAIDECRKNEMLCSQLARLETFQTKYREFIRGVATESSVTSV